MNRERLQQLQETLEEKTVILPAFVKQYPEDWTARLLLARKLHQYGDTENAYYLLREIYEQNVFRFDKDIHGGYEDYIVEKVKFFQELATLSMGVTQDPRKSIPYLDEALIMLDGAESVYPYVNPKQIQLTKNEYIEAVKKNWQ